jgi:hypothetical protein
MRQSKIFRTVYEAVSEALAGEGEASGLFTLARMGCGERPRVSDMPAEGPAEARLYFEVTDLCQTAGDKSGQRLIAGEKSYEPPARFAMILALRGTARSYPALLEALGCAARFLKDNPAVTVGDCAWHGSGGRVFIEPVIREPSSAAGRGDAPFLTLYYRVEAALNSEKGKSFRRVEKRDLRTQVK